MFKQYSEEFRDQVVKRSEEIGNKKAAIEYNVPENTVYKWRAKARKNAQDTLAGESQETEQTVDTTFEEPIKYNDEMIKRVLMRAEESGVKMAAFEFSIPLAKVEEWVEKDKAEKSATDKLSKPVADVQADTVAKVDEPQPPIIKSKRKSKYSDEFKARVLKRVEEIGVKDAAIEFIISSKTVEKWMKESEKSQEPLKEAVTMDPAKKHAKQDSEQKQTKKPSATKARQHSEEFKQRVLKRVKESGSRNAAAKEFRVSTDEIIIWQEKEKERKQEEKARREEERAKRQQEKARKEEERAKERAKKEEEKAKKQQKKDKKKEEAAKAEKSAKTEKSEKTAAKSKTKEKPVEKPESHSRQSRYSDEFKAQVVKRAIEVGNKRAAAEYEVSPESIGVSREKY